MAVPKLRFKDFDQDWTGLKIKDLVKSLDAGVSVNSEEVEPQEYEYSVLKTSCISSGYFDENERKRVLQDGEIQRLKEPVLDDSILMSRMNTPLLVGMNAYVFKAPKNTFLPDRLWQLKIDNNKTVTRWLAFYLGSDQGLNQIRDLASGTSNSMKNITKPDVLNIDLFAPQKEEQTKIASFLSNVDEKISQLTQKHALLSQYKQGMMQKLFSQQLRFKADDGSEFGEWEEVRLGNLVDLTSGFAFKSDFFSEDGNKLITPKNFTTTGKANFTDTNTKWTTEISDKKYICRPNDLLVLLTDLTQSCELLGKPILLSQDDGNVLLNQRIVKIIPNRKLEKPFLLYLLLTDDFHELIVSTASGTTVKHSSNKVLQSFHFYLPCLEEQTKIANFLSAIDQKIEVVAHQIEQAKQWKKGLLQQMFV